MIPPQRDTGPDRRTIAKVAELIRWLRPDLPPPLAESYAVEALEQADQPSLEELDPDRRWEQIRRATYPAAKLAARRAEAFLARTGRRVDTTGLLHVDPYDVDQSGYYRDPPPARRSADNRADDELTDQDW
jgi:hypothetical protein